MSPSVSDFFFSWKPKDNTERPAAVKQRNDNVRTSSSAGGAILDPVADRCAVVNPAVASQRTYVGARIAYIPPSSSGRLPSSHTNGTTQSVIVPGGRNVVIPTRVDRTVWPAARPAGMSEGNARTQETLSGLVKSVAGLAAALKDVKQIVEDMNTRDEQRVSQLTDICKRVDELETIATDAKDSVAKLSSRVDELESALSSHEIRLGRAETKMEMHPLGISVPVEAKYAQVDSAVLDLTDKVESLLVTVCAEKDTNRELLRLLRAQCEDSARQEAKIEAMSSWLENARIATIPNAVDESVTLFKSGRSGPLLSSRVFASRKSGVDLFGCVSIQGPKAPALCLEFVDVVEEADPETQENALNLPLLAMDRLDTEGNSEMSHAPQRRNQYRLGH